MSTLSVAKTLKTTVITYNVDDDARLLKCIYTVAGYVHCLTENESVRINKTVVNSYTY